MGNLGLGVGRYLPYVKNRWQKRITLLPLAVLNLNMVTQPLEPLRVVCYVAGPTTKHLREELGTVLQYAQQDLGHDRVLHNENDFKTVVEAIDDEVQDDNDDPCIHLYEQTPDGEGQQIRIYYDRLAVDDPDNIHRLRSVGERRPGATAALETISASETADRHVVVASADRLLDNDGGLDWIDRIVSKHHTSVHLANDRVTLRSGADLDGSTRRALALLASHSTDPEIDTGTHKGGRPPLGFTSEDGKLVPDDNYDEVVSVLHDVKYSSTSIRSAARKIGCARQTVRNALDRPQLYVLNQE